MQGEPPNPYHATGGEGGEPPKPTPEPHHTTGRGGATHNHTTPHHKGGREATHHHTTPQGGGGEEPLGGEGKKLWNSTPSEEMMATDPEGLMWPTLQADLSASRHTYHVVLCERFCNRQGCWLTLSRAPVCSGCCNVHEVEYQAHLHTASAASLADRRNHTLPLNILNFVGRMLNVSHVSQSLQAGAARWLWLQ